VFDTTRVGFAEGRVLSTSFFWTNECLLFSRDFENLITISWMEEGESVDSTVYSQLLGPSHADRYCHRYALRSAGIQCNRRSP
jgi:hypothetical protein